MNKVYWLTGLSGAGKTTIGTELHNHLKAHDPTAVLLDGDTLRAVFGDVFGYSSEERRKCAMCYSRLCKMLLEQGITVVCCTISMFDSIREWNRENIKDYTEVYIKVSPETLIKRNQKGLYSDVNSGDVSLVVGMDLDFEEPKMPDIIIENDGSLTARECAKIILNKE